MAKAEQLTLTLLVDAVRLPTGSIVIAQGATITPQTPDNAPVISTAKAAKALGFDSRTVLRMLEDGDLTGFQARKRGAWRVHVHSVQALKRQGSNSQTDDIPGQTASEILKGGQKREG